MNQQLIDPQQWAEIVDFWFKELKPVQWFVTSAELDQMIKTRYLRILDVFTSTAKLPPVTRSALHDCAITTPDQILATILLTDQFSRNIFRGEAAAFSTDSLALALSAYLIDIDGLKQMSKMQIQFAVMPHMHAESLEAQEKCVSLFTQYQIDKGLQSANEHLDIIRQFGRFPHRNQILGRKSSGAELLYLRNGNTFGQ